MEVIVPKRIEAVSTALDWLGNSCFLRFILRDEDDLAIARSIARTASHVGQDVLARAIDDCLRRIETQAVQVVLTNPVLHIAGEELAHWAAVLTVEIDGVAPLRRLLAMEVII